MRRSNTLSNPSSRSKLKNIPFATGTESKWIEKSLEIDRKNLTKRNTPGRNGDRNKFFKTSVIACIVFYTFIVTRIITSGPLLTTDNNKRSNNNIKPSTTSFLKKRRLSKGNHNNVRHKHKEQNNKKNAHFHYFGGIKEYLKKNANNNGEHQNNKKKQQRIQQKRRARNIHDSNNPIENADDNRRTVRKIIKPLQTKNDIGKLLQEMDKKTGLEISFQTHESSSPSSSKCCQVLNEWSSCTKYKVVDTVTDVNNSNESPQRKELVKRKTSNNNDVIDVTQIDVSSLLEGTKTRTFADLIAQELATDSDTQQLYDFIYINDDNESHHDVPKDYCSIYNDISVYYRKLLKPGGVMVGHASNKSELLENDNDANDKWSLCRKDNTPFSSSVKGALIDYFTNGENIVISVMYRETTGLHTWMVQKPYEHQQQQEEKITKTIKPLKTRNDIGKLLEELSTSKNSNSNNGLEVGILQHDNMSQRNGERNIHNIVLKDWISCTSFTLVDLWSNKKNVDLDNNGNNNLVIDVKEEENSHANIQVLQMSPNETIDYFNKGRNKFSFIYLNELRTHEYYRYKENLELYWSLLDEGGVLAGHDYMDAYEIQGIFKDLDWSSSRTNGVKKTESNNRRTNEDNENSNMDDNWKKDYGSIRGAVEDFAESKNVIISVIPSPYFNTWMIQKKSV